MKKATSKKMTIDDLAVMVAKGFDGVYKKFDEVDNRFDEVKKDIAEVKENLASTRRDVLAMANQLIRGSATDRFTPSCFRPRREFANSEFHDLANRVGLLEQRAKTKK